MKKLSRNEMKKVMGGSVIAGGCIAICIFKDCFTCEPRRIANSVANCDADPVWNCGGIPYEYSCGCSAIGGGGGLGQV